MVRHMLPVDSSESRLILFISNIVGPNLIALCRPNDELSKKNPKSTVTVISYSYGHNDNVSIQRCTVLF